MASLLQPVALGKLKLHNRVVMASMTRNRCVDSYKPGPAHVKYYADRARDGASIIVTEGVMVDWSGTNYKHPPFLVTDEHCEAWRPVVDAVHREGALIFVQAWHPGRCQHEEMEPLKSHGGPILAPSAVRAEGTGLYRNIPGVPGHTKDVQAIENPQDVVEAYRKFFRLAKKAGFDGVELLCQGGYLPHQFLMSRANKRTDNYGGSVENRCRFVLDLVDAASKHFGGPEWVCVKISPADVLNDSAVTFHEVQEIYPYLIKKLVQRRVGIVNVCRRGAKVRPEFGDFISTLPRPEGFELPPNYDPLLDFGCLVKFSGSHSMLMANHDYTVQEADQLVREGKIDLIQLGRPFIHNPDVVARIRKGISFATNDRGDSVNYGPYSVPDENYNDWPAAA